MKKFSKWARIAQSVLAASHPKFRLSHTRECLASWLGRRTCASLKTQDLGVLDGIAKYV